MPSRSAYPQSPRALDGTGYPSGLSGEGIPIGARILAVVDSFDALTSERPYRPAVSREAAIRMLQSQAGKAFDPAILARFTELLPGLIPPTNDGLRRRMNLSKDPVSHQLGLGGAERLGSDAFRHVRKMA